MGLAVWARSYGLPRRWHQCKNLSMPLDFIHQVQVQLKFKGCKCSYGPYKLAMVGLETIVF